MASRKPPLLERLKTTLFFAAAILLAAVSIWWTFTTFVEFSGFAAAFAKAVIGITAWFAFDKIVLREIDTITEIKKGNTAHAIFIFSYAIILAACIATA